LIGREASDQGKERIGSSGLVRWGAVSLILGGAAWIVLGLTAVFGYLQAIPGREDVALFGAHCCSRRPGWCASTPCR
jgi:hypothetical protein